jgi:hypothetical protein
VLATLAGLGLSSAAGLNAYIPLLLVGLCARFTDWLYLPDEWSWLEHPAALTILGLLLAIEVVVDKVPGADTVNDVLQTVLRPTSGGIAFGAGSASLGSTTVTAGSGEVSTLGIICGVVLALLLHGLKALARPVANAASFGAGGIALSFAEDASSLTLSVLAILIPLALVLFLPLFAALVVWILRLRRRRRVRRALGAEAEPSNR